MRGLYSLMFCNFAPQKRKCFIPEKMTERNIEKKGGGKLGFWGLTAIVFGMVVGSGIYNIPQNMAAGAGLGAVSLAWIITAAGMLLLVATFKTLADRRPDLSAGIYQYAQAGYGNYTGFNMAWGYWLCTCFANIAYAVMLCDSFGAFFPSMLDSGPATVIFGTVLIWTMFFIVSKGLKTAKFINNFLSVIKVVVIAVIIGLIAVNVRLGMLTSDFWGRMADVGGLGDQIKSTMLVTLWCFIGIEGAVMMSAHAKKPTDVGKAGVAGFFIAWLMYVLVSVLCFGVMSQPQLAGLDNPSVAYVLKTICGDWAYYFVIVSVIVSLLGGWVAWTLVCAEVPYEAASVGILPKRFLRLNSKGMPTFGLAVSSVVMQIFLIIVVTANDFYLAALSITGMMILPAYLFSGLYLWKTTLHPEQLGLTRSRKNMRFRITGIACSAYCLWMLYSGGLTLLFLTSVFYLAGSVFFIMARREANSSGGTCRIKIFTPVERYLFFFIAVCAAVSVWLLAAGIVSI